MLASGVQQSDTIIHIYMRVCVCVCVCVYIGFLVALLAKNLPANIGDVRDEGWIPGLGRYPREGMATHSSILAWGIP